MLIYLLLFATGLFSGFLAGLFGIGGGVILVPVFWYLFSFYGIPDSEAFKLSIATSLAVIAVTTFVTSGFHLLKGNLERKDVLNLLVYIISGVAVGALVSHFLPGSALKKAFSVFLFLVALRMITERKSLFELKGSNFLVPTAVFLSAVSSTLFGIGGGVVVNSLLFSFSEMRASEVVALASGVSFLNALFGTLIYALIPAETFVNWQLGYVYLPAAFLVSVGALLGSRAGLLILRRVSHSNLKRAFGILLIFLSLKILFS